MNKRPVSYLQTDPRWKSKPYRVTGESSTIGSAGCGPTCAAMLIETLTGKTYTPEDACKWSVEHGYKAKNQGTYYAYFKPQFAAFGIECDMLNWANTYGKPNHENHKKAFDLLKQGYYLIALMNKGLWTSSGHFVVVWWEDGKVRINDPASTKDARLNGDLETFKSQVKYYWWVDTRQHNKGDDDMDQTTFDKMMDDWLARKAKEAPADWSKEDREWAEENGLIFGDGSGTMQYHSFATREQLMVFLHRLVQLFIKK
jgi:hypothetical protein